MASFEAVIALTGWGGRRAEMEITTSFDPGVVERLLDRIERDMDELRAAVPVQFAEWQSDDMGRKKPRTKTIESEKPTSNFVRSSTFIMPTSRYRVKLRRRAIRKLRKRAPEMDQAVQSARCCGRN